MEYRFLLLEGILNKIKQVDKRPTTGQFIACWHYQGVLWSDTFKYINDSLKIYDKDTDDWCKPDGRDKALFICNPTYFVSES